MSLFLSVCLRRDLGRSWRQLAKLLAGEHGSGWRRLFGFQEGITPSASGLRFFFQAVGPDIFEEINCLLIEALHQAALLPERSTFPDDPPDRGVTISHDLMLRKARSNMHCAYVTATCCQGAHAPAQPGKPVRKAATVVRRSVP